MTTILPALTTHSLCHHCGAPLAWKLADLEYHARRVERGEHAACACDDDCAAECDPWEGDELARAREEAGR